MKIERPCKIRALPAIAALAAAIICSVALGAPGPAHLGTGDGVRDSQSAANPASRPILFVHDFCGSPQDSTTLTPALYGQLSSALYPSQAVYYVQYNDRADTTTFFETSGAVIEPGAIPSTTRFFAIELFNPVNESTASTDVANVSILNKAYEIEQAIVQITAITHIADVIVVGHGMGGLDARAYIENMASAGACYDSQANVPNYLLNTCLPGAGEAAYGADVGDLVTIDTPHAGTPLDTFNLAPYAQSLGACIANESVNRQELNPSQYGGPGLIEALNYGGGSLGAALPAANTAPVQAVEDYFDDVTNSWDDLNGKFSGYADDMVLLASQSVQQNIPSAHSKAAMADVPVSFASNDPGIAYDGGCWAMVPYLGTTVTEPMLHAMPCLAGQQGTASAIAQQITAHTAGTLTSVAVNATLNGAAWKGALSYKLIGPSQTTTGATAPATVSDLALGAYSLSYVSGGPAVTARPKVTAAPSATLKRGQWSATFTVAFTGTVTPPPAATTIGATAITATGATLKGSVNPEDKAGKALFEWSTTATLASPKIACTGGLLKNCPAVVANAKVQSFTTKITAAPASTKIYYRMCFYNSTSKAYTCGKIAGFTTAK